MKNKTFILILISLFGFIQIQAQDSLASTQPDLLKGTEIKGSTIYNDMPLVGSIIKIKDSKILTIVNADGEFGLFIPIEYIGEYSTVFLEITCKGFKERLVEVRVPQKSSLRIHMQKEEDRSKTSKAYYDSIYD